MANGTKMPRPLLRGIIDFHQKKSEAMTIKAFQFKAGRHKSYPEKYIFPTMMFVNANHEAFEESRIPGVIVAIAWWDFYVKFYLLFTK